MRSVNIQGQARLRSGRRVGSGRGGGERREEERRGEEMGSCVSLWSGRFLREWGALPFVGWAKLLVLIPGPPAALASSRRRHDHDENIVKDFQSRVLRPHHPSPITHHPSPHHPSPSCLAPRTGRTNSDQDPGTTTRKHLTVGRYTILRLQLLAADVNTRPHILGRQGRHMCCSVSDVAPNMRLGAAMVRRQSGARHCSTLDSNLDQTDRPWEE